MRNKNIVFLGTHGQMNIGDELLLETFLTQLGAENRYFVNSYDPAFTAAQLGAHFHAEVFNTATERSKLLKYLWQADLLFFGGGSIIKELYASTGTQRVLHAADGAGNRHLCQTAWRANPS
jgi:polysaccharide pyruvyl transferase WcaK-like protein